MAQTIYIRLPALMTGQQEAGDIQVQWCASDGIGRPTAQSDPLQAVLETVGGRPVVLLAPAEEVVLTDVDLPIRQRNKLLQAVPFALEEQFAEDVEKLHFAVGERQANGRIPVVAVAHERMQAWLGPFRDAGITPKAIIPDVLCLPGPVDDEHWSAVCEQDHMIVRTDSFHGFACDLEALPDYLSLATAGEDLRLKIAATRETDLSALRTIPARIETDDEKLNLGLEAMRLILPEGGLNLLQGAYAPQSGYQHWWRPLRLTAALLVAWIVLLTAVHAVDYFRLSSEVSALEEDNSELIARLFPEIKTLVPGSERVQLQRRLDELRGGDAQAGLFSALSALAKGMQSVGKLKLEELQLRNDTLYLNMTGQDISTLEKLKSHFEKQPQWSLEVQSANASSEGVRIRASLGRAG